MLISNIIATGIGIAVTTVIITGCASMSDDVSVDFDPATSASYERRDELPEISTLPDNELIAAGHIILGTATTTQVIEKCWDKSQKCDSETQSTDVTAALLVEAMDQGADIVVLTADRETSFQVVEKRGQCLKMSRVCQSTTKERPTYPECRKSGTCAQMHIPDDSCESVCTVFEKISGSVQIETSSGTLWRHQPQ